MFNFFRRKPKLSTRSAVQPDNLQALGQVLETLDRFQNGNLLYFDFKRKTVTISAALAELFIYDETDWQRFLYNVHLWAVCKYNIVEYHRNYTRAMADAEAAAFRAKNEQVPEADRQSLTESERRLARMRAAARFDQQKPDRRGTLPDLQFMVIGATDGEPIVVARLLNGRYETLPVPGE